MQVPQIALRYHFLMRRILAVPALHLAHTAHSSRLRDQYLNRAVSHQDKSLAEDRSQLKTLNPDNYSVVFIYSTTVTIFAFSYPLLPHSTDPQGPVDDLLRVLHLTRGMQRILDSSEDWIMHSELAILLQYEERDLRLSSSVQKAVDRLHTRNQICTQQGMENHDEAAFTCAVRSLRVMFSELEHDAPDIKIIPAHWAIGLPEGYFACLQYRNP